MRRSGGGDEFGGFMQPMGGEPRSASSGFDALLAFGVRQERYLGQHQTALRDLLTHWWAHCKAKPDDCARIIAPTICAHPMKDPS